MLVVVFRRAFFIVQLFDAMHQLLRRACEFLFVVPPLGGIMGFRLKPVLRTILQRSLQFLGERGICCNWDGRPSLTRRVMILAWETGQKELSLA